MQSYLQTQTPSHLSDSEAPTTIASQTITTTDSSHEEKKEQHAAPPSNMNQEWVDYNDLPHPPNFVRLHDRLVVHRKLFEKLGVIALAAPYEPSTQARAEQFVSKNSVMLGNTIYQYGRREKIEEEFKWPSDRFETSDKLRERLQTLADEKDHAIGVSYKTTLKNTYGFFKTDSSPISYQPLILQNGILEDGSPDSYSLRIYPFVSKRSEPYRGTRFPEFIFSYCMFGAGLQGRAMSTHLEDISIFTEAMNFGSDKTIFHVRSSSTSFYEQAQMTSLNLLVLMMKRLGEKNFKAICNLHYADYILYALLLYFNEKISKFALDELLIKILIQKTATEQILLNFFKSHQIKLSFSSSLDNLFTLENPEHMAYSDFFLSQLKMQDRMPDKEDNNYIPLLRACLIQLALNDLSLMSISNKTQLSDINKLVLIEAQEEKQPILIRREKKDPSNPMIQDEFFMYGDNGNDPDGMPIWIFTKITAKNVDHLNQLPFDEGFMYRSNDQFNQKLIDTLKEGHAPFNPTHPNHIAVWNDFFRVVNEKNVEIDTLSAFLNVADAITIAIEAKKTPPHGLCSVEPCSRRSIQEAEGWYTRLSDFMKTKVVPGGYCTVKLDHPSTVATQQLKKTPNQVFTDHYPSVLFISVFDLCIGANLSDQNNQNNNTACYFKDTPSALQLAKWASLFGKTSRNGVLGKDDPRRTRLPSPSPR